MTRRIVIAIVMVCGAFASTAAFAGYPYGPRHIPRLQTHIVNQPAGDKLTGPGPGYCPPGYYWDPSIQGCHVHLM